MKRDLDIVRYILMSAEDADGPIDGSALAQGCGASIDCIGYHIELMKSYGLIDGEVKHALGGRVASATVVRLTWDGCDYLDAIKSDQVWSKAKEAIETSVGDVTLSVAKSVCTALSLALVKQALGI